MTTTDLLIVAGAFVVVLLALTLVFDGLLLAVGPAVAVAAGVAGAVWYARRGAT